MAIKKSELYSSLWASCDELRGGMDASQYKDYVLVMLFVKYVSDKYAGVPYAPITLPEGASFKDMVALKGKSDIGDQINKKIIEPLRDANKLSTMPDFNSAEKLGSGKELVDRLTNLIGIFENPALNFSNNRAGGDDILGDAYEYLMRHFATESGKSKGQFYTPAEVSRVMAQIIGIHDAQTTTQTTVYDPTCGSGSLLLKVVDEAPTGVTPYGQEKDSATAGLARMNMILHDNPTAEIKQGNTLANPLFRDKHGELLTFDFVVANPPFSDKRWSTGLHPNEGGSEAETVDGGGPKDYGRFEHFGIPPAKQGDFAYLLHIVHSLKSRGKGACILPHGVLFRGHAEADIRRNLLRRGLIKGIIGLPANLFYGTGIPACIIIIDKEQASVRKGVFMIDASKGYIKDGNKNRLRSRDIHKIVDVYNKGEELPGYSRMVSLEEIASKNAFNLNIPRYIDSQQAEDVQDIDAHLRGGIPARDIDRLDAYWQVCPNLKQALFRDNRPGYLDLTVDRSEIREAIYHHPEFTAFMAEMQDHYQRWQQVTADNLKALAPGCQPKQIITAHSEALLDHYRGKPLIDPYAVYQHLMDYWAETMQDDCYLIAADGWKAEPELLYETVRNGKKKGQQVGRGWVCDLVPKPFIVARYFAREQAAIDAKRASCETLEAELTELEETHGGDEGALSGVSNTLEARMAWNEALMIFWQTMDEAAWQAYHGAQYRVEDSVRVLLALESEPELRNLENARGKITQGAINARLKQSTADQEQQLLERWKYTTAEIKAAKQQVKRLLETATTAIETRLDEEPDNESLTELRVLRRYLELNEQISRLKSAIRAAENKLDTLAYEKYADLSEDEIKVLVVDDKWLATLSTAVSGELDQLSQGLGQRLKVLAERYATPMPRQTERVAELEQAVSKHLEQMGFAWQ